MGDDERGIRWHNNLANTQHEDGAGVLNFVSGGGMIDDLFVCFKTIPA